jgi:hypothetical protein
MLGGFQKMVLFSAVIILMIALVLIGIALRYSSAKSWPPIVPDCPDYWVIDGSGNNTNCINVKDLGTCPAKDGKKHLVMNFNDPAFAGENGASVKYDWAKRCNISWDGITYGVAKPE